MNCGKNQVCWKRVCISHAAKVGKEDIQQAVMFLGTCINSQGLSVYKCFPVKLVKIIS